MADRMGKGPAATAEQVSASHNPAVQWAADRMREACTHVARLRGPAFRQDAEGQLVVGPHEIALRSIAVGPGDAMDGSLTALMSVLPGSDLHVSRHTRALGITPHALLRHGAALAAVDDGTLVLVQPLDLRLYDCEGFAAALIRFTDLASLICDQLDLPARKPDDCNIC